MPRAGYIWAIIALIVAGTLLCWTLSLSGLPPIPAPFHIPWPVLAAGFAAGHFAGIRIEFRNSNHSLDLTDVALLPAIVFAGPGAAILAAVLGSVVPSLFAKRPLIKTALNVTLHGFAVSVALVSFHAILGTASVLSSRGWIAAIVAIVVAEVVTDAGTQLVIALAVGRFATNGWDRVWLLLAVGIDATLGLAAVHLFWASVDGGILFVALAVAVGIEYATHGRLRMRHTRLNQLYRFERALAGMVESDHVIGAVLTEALVLFNAEVAQLIVPGTTSVIAHTLRAGHGAPVTHAGPNALADLLDASSGVLLAPARGGDPDLARVLGECGFRDAIALRLATKDGATGEFLVVADRLGGEQMTFGPADVTLAETLAAPTAMALRSSDLLNKLREEIALKEHQASHDPLTGLANRALLSVEIDRALARRSIGALVGVMVIDMDEFKSVNDTFGHEAGDAFLEVLARRLEGVVGDRGTVGRLGGDEFAVVVPYARNPAEIAAIAADLDITIRSVVALRDATVERRGSIGVSIAPHHGNERSVLLREADLAMYMAKQHGGGVVVHSDTQREEIDRPSLVAALREAIRTSTLDLRYQPKTSFETGKVLGVEALLRWTHPVFGPITPDQFIPVAESSGLIRPLTRWVLATAIAQCSIWHQEGLDLTVAVNLSPTQIDDPEVVTQVRQLLDAHRLPPSSLILEITESGALAGQSGDEGHVLEPLAELGVALSIDDFGVGTSSLSRIKHLPVSEIKIDKSFIVDLAPDSVDEAIVASTINLAHQLGLHVVAEGVETETTYRQLASLGCDIAQGHLVSVALRPDDLTAWIKAATRPSPTGPRWISSAFHRLTST